MTLMVQLKTNKTVQDKTSIKVMARDKTIIRQMEIAYRLEKEAIEVHNKT